MSELQMNDAKKLWNEMGNQKNWGSLESALKQHKNTAKGIDDSTVKLLSREVDDLKKSGKPFPSSAEELSTMLNKRMNMK